MVWVGIAIGFAVGSLMILAFWLGQKSVAVAQDESRDGVDAPEAPVSAIEEVDVSSTAMEPEPREPDTALDTKSAESSNSDEERSTSTEPHEETLEVPFQVDLETSTTIPATTVREMTVDLLETRATITSSDAVPQSSVRRRWVGLDATFCGAIHNVRDTFPAGTNGTFRYQGSPSGGWKAQFRLGDNVPLAVNLPQAPVTKVECPSPLDTDESLVSGRRLLLAALEAEPNLVTTVGPSRRSMPTWVRLTQLQGVLLGSVASLPREAQFTRTVLPHVTITRVIHPRIHPAGGRSPYDISRDWDSAHYWSSHDYDDETLDDDTYTRYLVNSVEQGFELKEHFRNNRQACEDRRCVDDPSSEPEQWLEWWTGRDERLV